MIQKLNPNGGCKSSQKTSNFRLHLEGELCIIIARPPPRWAKWSRGVRTRGLRVGLVGGPRPLLFLAPETFLNFASLSREKSQIACIDFQKKWHNIRHG